jgi:hypothetical protein
MPRLWQTAGHAGIGLPLPLLWLLSRWPMYPRRFMPALSLGTALTGAIWVAGRL